MNKPDKEVLFLYPNPYNVGEQRMNNILNMPGAFLALSAFLEKNGIPTRIIDTRAEDFRDYDLSKALFVGITCLTGAMIKNGLDLARYVRDRFPDLPIIWGGAHPSSLPLETIKHPLVDAVCVGEGEYTVLELAEKLVAGESIDEIQGLLTKNNSLTLRPLMDMNELPPLPYHKLKLEKYKNSTFFEFGTSRGCPHDCIFCYNHAINRDYKTNRAQTRIQSSSYVLDQIDQVAKKYPIEVAGFVDDNFFMSRKRVQEIAQGIVDRGYHFKWFANGVASYFKAYSDELMALMKQSGCFRIDIGGESGSQKLLNRIAKGTKVDDIVESAKKCAKHGIIPSYSFIIGWPDETDEDMEMTLSLIDRLHEEIPTVWINGLYVITPFPGTPYMEEAIRGGVRIPTDLEGWGHYLFAVDVKHNIPWHNLRRRHKIMLYARLSKMSYRPGKKVDSPYKHNFFKHWAYVFMSYDARFRWKYRFTAFALEWKLWDWLFRRYNKV